MSSYRSSLGRWWAFAASSTASGCRPNSCAELLELLRASARAGRARGSRRRLAGRRRRPARTPAGPGGRRPRTAPSRRRRRGTVQAAATSPRGSRGGRRAGGPGTTARRGRDRARGVRVSGVRLSGVRGMVHLGSSRSGRGPPAPRSAGGVGDAGRGRRALTGGTVARHDLTLLASAGPRLRCHRDDRAPPGRVTPRLETRTPCTGVRCSRSWGWRERGAVSRRGGAGRGTTCARRTPRRRRWRRRWRRQRRGDTRSARVGPGAGPRRRPDVQTTAPREQFDRARARRLDAAGVRATSSSSAPSSSGTPTRAARPGTPATRSRTDSQDHVSAAVVAATPSGTRWRAARTPSSGSPAGVRAGTGLPGARSRARPCSRRSRRGTGRPLVGRSRRSRRDRGRRLGGGGAAPQRGVAGRRRRRPPRRHRPLVVHRRVDGQLVTRRSAELRALPDVLRAWRDQGWTFARLSDLIPVDSPADRPT